MLTQHSGLIVRSCLMPLIAYCLAVNNEYYSILVCGWKCSSTQSNCLKRLLFINQSTLLKWKCLFFCTAVITSLYGFAAASLSCFNLSSSVIPINLVWKDYTVLCELVCVVCLCVCLCDCFCTSVSTNPFPPL